MKSYLTSQDFKDIIAKAVKEAVGQAMEGILKELKAEIAVLEGQVQRCSADKFAIETTNWNAFQNSKIIYSNVSFTKPRFVARVADENVLPFASKQFSFGGCRLRKVRNRS